MSLSRYAEEIARAVAGELSPAEEAPLREHLRGCAECRSHYDALSLAARALKGGETGDASRRAEERLLAALEPKPQVARPRRAYVWWALATPAAVAIAMAVFTTVVPPPGQDDVVMRGAAEPDAGSFSVQLFAKSKEGGALRLVAEFPGSGEGRVTARDWLQVKFVPNPRGGRVYAVDAKGTPVEIGTSGSLSLPAGSYEVWALHDLSMTEAQALEDAKAPWPPGALPVKIDARAQVARGKLQVDP